MRRLLIAVVTTTAVVSGCDNDQQPAELDPVERAERYEDVVRAPAVSFAKLVEDPARYEGQTVQVRGTVRAMLNPRAFVLEASDLISPSVVVLSPHPAKPMGWVLQAGQQAVAVGIVRTGDIASVERELGRSLQPDVRRALTGPIVIARSVGRVHGDNIDWAAPTKIR